MKKIITICAAILMTASVFAQAPNKMSYQAVIRNASNVLVTNQAIGMRISILQSSPSGPSVYVETQTPTTNSNGLASIEIGSGTVVSGNFSTIDWSNGPYFVKTETDPTGGISYSINGTSQLLSVPYALFASRVSSNGGASQWKTGTNNSIYYKNGISRVGIGLINPNAGLDVRRIGDNNLGTIFLANFEALDTTGSQGYDHGAFVRMSTNDFRGRLDLGGAQFNASTNIGSILHTTGGWQWNRQLNIMGNVGIGTNSPSQMLSVAGIIETTNGGVKFPDGTIQTTASTGGASQWTANGSTIYYNTGNVGIGIPANINYPLVVGGTTRITDNIGSTPDEFTIIPETNNNRIRLVGSYFNSGTYPDFTFELGGTSRMFMQASSGNVGIGTTSPARTLHVNSVMRLEPIATAPTSPAKGDMYFDSTLNKLRVYDGSTWQNCW